MTNKESLVIARKARKSGAKQNEKTATQQSRQTVSQVWRDGVATSKREALNADISGREEPKKGTDGRVWMNVSTLRRVFKEIQDDGSWGRRCGIFGVSASRTSDLGATVAVTSSVLDVQAESIQKEIEAGGSVCTLQWEMDSTPQQVALYCPKARDVLRDPRAEGTEDVEKREKHGTRDVFVQRGRLKILEAAESDPDDVHVRTDEEVFIPPFLLGSSFSSTLRDAFFHALELCGLCLKKLSGSFGLVVLIVSVDGCFGNALLVDWLHDVLPNNIILMEDLCTFHNSNRIVIDHVQKGKFDINSLFCLSRVFHISTYYDLFCSAVLTTAFSLPIVWSQFGGPSRT